MQDKTLTNLMETTLTNKTVLKRTSILQIKSTPNNWYVVGTDTQTFLQTQESALLTTHLHVLVGSTTLALCVQGPVHFQLYPKHPGRTAHMFWQTTQNFFLRCAKLRTAAVSQMKGPCI